MNSENLEVTQKITFECCYVSQPPLSCGPLNAHRYQFEATISNPQSYSDTGRVISFENLKQAMQACSFGGYFLYQANDVLAKAIAEAFENYGVHTKSFKDQISAELILETLTQRLSDIVNNYGLGSIVKETKLRENTNSYVTWKRKEN